MVFRSLTFEADVKSYSYGPDHPMKPKRVAMTHELIEKYGMYQELKVYVIFASYSEKPICYRSGDDAFPLSRLH